MAEKCSDELPGDSNNDGSEDLDPRVKGESDLDSAPKIFLLIYFVRHELTFSCAETAPACVSLRQYIIYRGLVSSPLQ
eukprot:gene3163-3632_t